MAGWKDSEPWCAKRWRVQCQKTIQLRDFFHLNDLQGCALLCNVYTNVDILCTYYKYTINKTLYIYIQYKYLSYIYTTCMYIYKYNINIYIYISYIFQNIYILFIELFAILKPKCSTHFAGTFLTRCLLLWTQPHTRKQQQLRQIYDLHQRKLKYCLSRHKGITSRFPATQQHLQLQKRPPSEKHSQHGSKRNQKKEQQGHARRWLVSQQPRREAAITRRQQWSPKHHDTSQYTQRC